MAYINNSRKCYLIHLVRGVLIYNALHTAQKRTSNQPKYVETSVLVFEDIHLFSAVFETSV